MAERDATVRRGSQPRPVTRWRSAAAPGETPSDQDERPTDDAAGQAGEDDPATAGGPAPAASAGAADAAREGSPATTGGASAEASGVVPGAAGEGAAGPSSPEEPTPGITGTADPRTAAGEASGDPAGSPPNGPRTASGGAPGADLATSGASPAAPANTESDDAGPATGSAVARRPRAELVRIETPFPTEESLAQQGEDADELRRQIDELRQMLDVGAVPPMPPAARRRRRAPLLVLAGGLVGLVAAAAAAVAVTGPDDDPGTAAPRPPASAGPSAEPSPSGAAADPALPAPLTPATGTAPTSGPGVTEPGTLLVVRVADDQTLHVTEQAVLDGPATRQVPLRLPGVQRLGGDIAELAPRVTDLRAALDGTPVAVRAAGPGSWFVPVGREATRVAVSYVVTGAVLPSRPSETGRALGLVSPLLGAGLAGADLPLVVRTTGTQVVGSSCPDAPAALQLCGVGDGRGNWTATVPASESPVVVLQVDLPGLA
jgi:hypothetical protein